jgi:hypothetical protein
MDALLKAESIPALLAAVIVILCVNSLRGFVEFLWNLRKEKDSASEGAIKELTDAVRLNTEAAKHLDGRLQRVEKIFNVLPKMKLDLRRLFTAMKTVAGDEWTEIREEIMSMKDDSEL